MKFTRADFGILVRPKNLSDALVFPEKNFNPSSLYFSSSYSHQQNTYPKTITEVYLKTRQDIFTGLTLGDTSADLSTCYVAKVVAFVARVWSHEVLVTPRNFDEFMAMGRKKYGKRFVFKPEYAKVEIYSGVALDKSGSSSFSPTGEVWNKNLPSGEKTSWFFRCSDLVPFTKIVQYEAIKNGELLQFRRGTNLVVSNKKMKNKKKFYNSNSWTCSNIFLLNREADGINRFSPNRYFQVVDTKAVLEEAMKQEE